MYFILEGVTEADWHIQIRCGDLHNFIYTESYPTVITIAMITLVGYIVIRFIPIAKQTPVMSIFGISSIYLGIFFLFILIIQTKQLGFLTLLTPISWILILIKSLYIFIREKGVEFQEENENKKLSKIVKRYNSLPIIAVITSLPLLGVIIIILLIFGQEPDSIIKAWTETADWTFSQKIPPESLEPNGHYLCTVAARGHKKVVKPIRIGNRHGKPIVINRQLCIANAFEQLIQEKFPTFHRIIRKIYDEVGYPISKHINSKYSADLVYFLMKPLEWIFIFILYTFDQKPENRIAIQYPHTEIPKQNKNKL